MKFLRYTLGAAALSAAVLVGACVTDDTTASDVHNTTEVSEALMQKTPEAPGEFALTRAKDGEWYFSGVGEKGQELLLSEGYVQRSSALNGILSVEENGVHLDRYEVGVTDAGTYSFVLRAGNNQVIAESREYRTQEQAEAAIASARDLVAGILQYKAAVTDGARFDLWRGEEDRQWYFVLRADDGRELLRSEAYTGRTGAVNGIESVRLNGKDETKYQIVQEAGEIYFILKAGNGHEIAESADSYDDVESAEIGIAETHELLLSEKVASPW
jgi:uncharacterized protein YegP (UPF0339 family)